MSITKLHFGVTNHAYASTCHVLSVEKMTTLRLYEHRLQLCHQWCAQWCAKTGIWRILLQASLNVYHGYFWEFAKTGDSPETKTDIVTVVTRTHTM